MIMFWKYISQKLAIVPADYVVYFLYTFLGVIVFNSARNSHAVYEENLPFLMSNLYSALSHVVAKYASCGN